MAVHPNTASMLRESLLEYLKVAEYCVEFEKDPEEWGEKGCYGFPASVMLFCIVDIIGNFHRRKKDFKVNVDGQERSIKRNDAQCFYILNSHYYNQKLSHHNIDQLYNNYRSLLIHSGAMPKDHFLMSKPTNPPGAFPIFPVKGKMLIHVNLFYFLEISRHAVELFFKYIDQIVPESEQAEDIRKRN